MKRLSASPCYFSHRSHDDLLGEIVIIDASTYTIIRLEPVEFTGEVKVRLREVSRPWNIRKTSLHLLSSLAS